MGKAALFAIVAFTLIGGYYTLSSQRGMIESVDRLSGHQYEVLARNAALAGYTQARQRIADAGGFSVPSQTGSFQGATYQTSVTTVDGGQAAVIRSSGVVSDGSDRLWTYDVKARILQEQVYEISDEPPMFMRFGLIVDSDLTLSGNILIDPMIVAGADNAQYNANIHTNGTLTVNGAAATIRGFGTYVVNRNVQHQGRVFNPYYNPTNEPVVQRVDPVAIPNLDFSVSQIAASLGPNQSHPGDYTLSGNIDYAAMGASRENPYVVHVGGNLTASGGTNITGYVIYLVEGDITFNGNVTMGQVQGPPESNFAFYSERDITIGGNARSLNGQIFAKRDIKFHGTPNIYGNVVAGRNADISGTPKIYYTPASPALTSMFQDPVVSFRLLSYNEW
jgi:hypothetical protein